MNAADRPTIIQTNAGQFFRVTEPSSADLAHCYNGVRVRRLNGEWVDAKGAREILVRKAETKVFPADAAAALAS